MNGYSREALAHFPWGKIKEVHEIGVYSIVEYLDPDDKRTKFHPFIEGEDTSISDATLEGALIFAIAYKHVGWNEAAFVMKAVKKILEIKD